MGDRNEAQIAILVQQARDRLALPLPSCWVSYEKPQPGDLSGYARWIRHMAAPEVSPQVNRNHRMPNGTLEYMEGRDIWAQGVWGQRWIRGFGQYRRDAEALAPVEYL